MTLMVSQRGVTAVVTNNYVSVTGLGSSKRFCIQYDDDSRISIMGLSKITTKNHHISSKIPPSMTVKLYIIEPFRSRVNLLPIVLVRTFELCHKQNKYAQLLHYLMSYQLQKMLQT